jgi:hypothetical protein
MGVSRTARSEQQHSMQGNHDQSRSRHLVKSPHPAVTPNMDRARDAHGRQSDHEQAKPGLMVPSGGEPKVDQAGDSCQGCTYPGVQDGPG